MMKIILFPLWVIARLVVLGIDLIAAFTDHIFNVLGELDTWWEGR